MTPDSPNLDLNAGPLRDAINAATRKNAVIFRGVTSDRFLYFERVDRSQPLSQAIAQDLAQTIYGSLRSLRDVDGVDLQAHIATFKGLRIA